MLLLSIFVANSQFFVFFSIIQGGIQENILKKYYVYLKSQLVQGNWILLSLGIDSIYEYALINECPLIFIIM